MASDGHEAGSTPTWDLSNLYGGFDAADYTKHRAALREKAQELRRESRDESRRNDEPVAWLRACINLINEVSDLEENLASYAYCIYSCDTTDARALREINGIERDVLPAASARVHFRNGLRMLESKLDSILSDDDELDRYRFVLAEELHRQRHQMSPEEEDLAADLARSGADAWSRLQDAISSTLSNEWNPETGESKTVVELRSLAHDPDREVRQKAYELELDAWKRMETPIAFALNGVKGTSVALNDRRGYADAIEAAVADARITRETLQTLISVMEESLPVFRRYLSAKAKKLGLDRLAFYDLFAPVGTSRRNWSYEDARTTIVEVFGDFSDELGAFARTAFDHGWIDARPRKGKVGGAYCTSLPLAKQSRVLANYDGTFGGVSTLAHELGHAYHHEVLKDYPALLRDYPMTLAETASIFCEQLTFNRALRETGGAEKLAILETFLQDCTQVIVDILSRYYFEQALFEQRPHGELSPDDLNRLMLDAQRKTYGDSLYDHARHPYMWAVKVHYYIPSLSYYNFPYAFGALFGIGLYGLYEREGDEFPNRYRGLLEMTGSTSAEKVTAGAGFDISSPDFWRRGISVIERHIAEYEKTQS